MAVGDLSMPVMHPIAGIQIGISESYIRYKNRRDLVVFELCDSAEVAAVFTQNAFCAAPVQLARRHLAVANTRYLVINTGNANAGTGLQGLETAAETCQALAQLVGKNNQTSTNESGTNESYTHQSITANQVLPFSTGVIGEQLPVDRLIAGLPDALANLSAQHWSDAASGIMTTDTLPKGASEIIEVAGQRYTITGISKGAGMIRPNMATMLAFVATDAPIAKPLLQQLLSQMVEQSFNRITIDGDTSTNDACVLIATAQAGSDLITSENDSRYPELLAGLQRVFMRLAQLIVRDGEGATKFITVKVEQGLNTQECCDVAYSVAHSPLIKTAFFASDPNWGRILAAVGNSGIAGLDVSKVQVWLDEVQICRDGGAAPDYLEEDGSRVMQQDEITIRIALGRGTASDTVWTCDLSYDYVKINADYRS